MALGVVVLAGSAALIYLLTRPKPTLGATFNGFNNIIQVHHETTTRQSDGAQGYDFWCYPRVNVTPDVSGQNVLQTVSLGS